MRFLHTADWHVGKTLAGRCRLDEQEQVSAEIVDIAKRERIDCVLLAGKGHERTMRMASGAEPWDERGEAEAAIKERLAIR